MGKQEDKERLSKMCLDDLRDYGQDHMNSGPDSFNIKILKLEYLHRETQTAWARR